jgi:hypothetical protein
MSRGARQTSGAGAFGEQPAHLRAIFERTDRCPEGPLERVVLPRCQRRRRECVCRSAAELQIGVPLDLPEDAAAVGTRERGWAIDVGIADVAQRDSDRIEACYDAPAEVRRRADGIDRDIFHRVARHVAEDRVRRGLDDCIAARGFDRRQPGRTVVEQS